MKVRELLEQLGELDPNTEVILSSDEEGNNYHVLEDIDRVTNKYSKRVILYPNHEPIEI